MPPSVGARPGTSVSAATHISTPKPAATPTRAVPSALRGGADALEHRDQQRDGDQQAGELADREATGGGAVDRLTGHRDGHAGGELRRGGLELLAGVRAEVGRVLVVADGGEGGPAVLGRAERIDRRDVGLALDLLQRRGEFVCAESFAPPALKTTTALVPDCWGKRCFEQVLRRLGLDARDREVVLERAADGHRRRRSGRSRRTARRTWRSGDGVPCTEASQERREVMRRRIHILESKNQLSLFLV